MPHQNHPLSAQNIARYARLFLTAITPFVASLSLDAAPITWGTPQTISTAENDVETNGILIYAIDASSSGDGTSSTTVAGKNGTEVEFLAYDAVNAESITGFSSKFRDSADFDSGNSDYGDIVDDGFFHDSNAVNYNTPAFATDTVVLSGLTIGETYLIQYWAQDADRNSFFTTVIDGATNLILDTDAGYATDFGQFVVGTFTADATTQTFSVSGAYNGSTDYDRAQLNAIQLRQIDEIDTINWGTPQTITTAAADVETDGILVFAIDASTSGDGSSSVTVTGKNGAEVSFLSYGALDADDQVGFSSKFRNAANFGGGSSDYGGIVDDGFWQGGDSIDGETLEFSTDTVILSGLTIGEEYLIQYWAQDAGRDPTFVTVLDGATNVILDTNDATYPNSGQFVVGTFTATAETKSFSVAGTLNGSNNWGRAQLNAIQVRRLQDPFIEWEPAVDMYPGSTTEAFVNNWSESLVLAYNATNVASTAGSITLNNVAFENVDSTELTAGYTDVSSGVTIQATTASESNNAFGDGGFSNNGDIFNVLQSGHWSLNTFTISGLTPGTDYQIQVFTNDARGSRNSDFKVGFSDGSQSHADSLIAGTAGLSDLNNTPAADASGDSIVGTFTATSGIQTFSIRGTNNAGSSWSNTGTAQVNALQIAVVEEPGDPLILTVGNTPQQQMRYGIDYERLWFWTGAASLRDRFAEWSVADCDVDYVRVAINAKYELTEGVLQEDAYWDLDDNEGGGTSNDRIIPMMQDMQAANPDIKFFASPRPLDEATNNVAWQPYPQWITGSTGSSSNFNFDEVKCSEYLLRYLILMKHHGFKISYMDLTNEWNYITGTDFKDITALFDAYVAETGTKPVIHPDYPTVTLVADDIPELVGPSAWSYTQGRSWLSGLYTGLRRDAVDIASCHNTDKGGTAQDFVDRLESVYSGEVVPEAWNTELHGWKSTSNADEVLTYAYMMECINAGFSGISGWLAVGTPNQGHSYIVNSARSVKYYMFEKLTNTSNRGYALEVNEPDELKVYWDPDPDQADADSAVSALIRGNLMTVWVLNHSNTDYPITINPTGRTISDYPIKVTRWSQIDGVSDEGETSTITAATNTSVVSLAQDNSAYCFEILLEPEVGTYTRIEAESYNSSSPASHSTETTTDIGVGLNLSNINDGNWTSYDDIDLSNATNIRFRIAAPSGKPDGEIEIRTGSQTGPVIGRTAIPVTGDWQGWLTIETPLAATAGTHDLYLVYTAAGSNQNGTGAMFNLNWFELILPAAGTPSAPTGLNATANGTTQIDLAWNAVSGATSYRVLRSTSSGGTYTEIASGLATTSTSDATASVGVPYFYVVRALNGAVESADSNIATATLPLVAPTGLTATANGSTQIDLAWNAVSGATSYRVLRSTSSGGTYTEVASGLATTSTSDAPPSVGVTYYYVVRAVNGAVESVNSNVANAALPLDTPIGLTATTISSSQIDLSWSSVTGATSYTVRRATVSGGPYSNVATGLGSPSYPDTTGLSPGTRYYYVVFASTSAVNSSDSSQVSAVPSNPVVIANIVIDSLNVDLGNDTFGFSIQNSELGHNYQAQETDHLSPPDWGDVGNVIPGNGGELQFIIDTTPSDTENFFRVRVWQQ
ncbi:MAG: carbohydrate-binding protein [Opitutaceae bacterium]